VYATAVGERTNRRVLRPLLPPLDRDLVNAQAKAWVERRTSHITDPAERVARASDIVNTQEANARRLKPARDKLALSLREYGPPRCGLAEATGVNRARLQALRDARPNGHVDEIADAWDLLPAAAVRVARAEARRTAAIKVRDAAAQQLMNQHGWASADVARLMRRDPSRASHVKYKTVEAAT
jgi:hypothetical protein